MSRIQYTVTFPAAAPGDDVTWPNTVQVFAEKDAQVPLQSGQTLNDSHSFSGWSDATSIVFTRPAGTNDTVTVTSGSPSGTGAAAPSAPGGSSPAALSLSLVTYGFPPVDLIDSAVAAELGGVSYQHSVYLPEQSSIAFRVALVGAATIPDGWTVYFTLQRVTDAAGAAVTVPESSGATSLVVAAAGRVTWDSADTSLSVNGDDATSLDLAAGTTGLYTVGIFYGP